MEKRENKEGNVNFRIIFAEFGFVMFFKIIFLLKIN